jgi:short-subunit dehydrogenase
VKVSVVCPGVVRTNIFENVVVVNMPRDHAFRPPTRMIEAAQAARAILDGVARNQAMIVFPASIRWLRHAYRLLPGIVDRYYFLPRLRDVRRYRTAASGR